MNEEAITQADLELFYSKVDGAFKSHQRFFQEELELFEKKLEAIEQQVATIITTLMMPMAILKPEHLKLLIPPVWYRIPWEYLPQIFLCMQKAWICMVPESFS